MTSSTQTELQLSPSRKAIADKFAMLSSRPPTTHSSAPNTSPFKRPLHTTSRINRGEAEYSDAKATTALNQSTVNDDLSITLNLSRLPNASLADFDLMGSAEDSFLAEARQMGEESFDRKLLQRTPQKDNRQRDAIARKSVSSTAHAKGASLIGIGRPSKIEGADATLSLGQRSFSNTSDTSDIFEEKGEESLLYASVRLDRAMPGGRSGDKVKMLEALAEYRCEKSAKSRTTLSTPLRASVTEGVRSKPRTRSSTSAAATPRATVAVGTTAQSAIPSSASTTSIPRGVPATPRGLAQGGNASAETPRSGAQGGTTPRSRPPLNASAARMRRLSGLPQLVAEDGSMRPPQAIRAKVTLVGSGSTPSTAATSSSSSVAAPRPRPRSMIGRPSMGGVSGMTSSSSSTTARVREIPLASTTAAPPLRRPATSYSSSSSPRKVLPRPSEGLTGQLSRRPISSTGQNSSSSSTISSSTISSSTISSIHSTSSIATLSSSSYSTGNAAPASASAPAPYSTRKPPRPFLLGAGTNHGPPSSSSFSSSSSSASMIQTSTMAGVARHSTSSASRATSPRRTQNPPPSSSSFSSSSSSAISSASNHAPPPPPPPNRAGAHLPRASLSTPAGCSSSSSSSSSYSSRRPISMIAHLPRPSMGTSNRSSISNDDDDAAATAAAAAVRIGRRISFGYRKADE